LGKRRRDGKSSLPQPLTSIQRIHIRRLVEKYGDDFQVRFSLLFGLLIVFSVFSEDNSLLAHTVFCITISIAKDKIS